MEYYLSSKVVYSDISYQSEGFVSGEIKSEAISALPLIVAISAPLSGGLRKKDETFRKRVMAFLALKIPILIE